MIPIGELLNPIDKCFREQDKLEERFDFLIEFVAVINVNYLVYLVVMQMVAVLVL